MLEKMSEFFERRLDVYDEHMMNNIECAGKFYPFTAECLPDIDRAEILDLGCGTGLELLWIYERMPDVKITGIDLSEGMLAELRRKFPNKDVELICGSYFELPLGNEKYDAAVSVESLHHFTKDEKIPLYQKLYRALRSGASFVLTDYFALTEDEEIMHREALEKQKQDLGICDSELYHYDTPLTVEHESEALMAAGFDTVELLGKWGATHTLKATKR